MTKISVMLARSFVSLCILLSYSPAVIPQTTTTGALVGRVFESGPTSKGISGATVVITNEENGLQRSITTSTNGDFYFGTLAVAHYTINVTAPGYQIQTISNFPVRVGKTNPVDVGLTQGSVNQTVTVQAGTDETITKSSQVSGSIDARRVAELPSNVTGDGIDTLALLVPGVTPGLGFSQSNGTQLSVNGNRERSNNFTIDGQDNNEIDIGGPILLVVNQDLIADFQIITSNPSAQFGRNMGGILNIVTKSGTSDFHGTGFWFYRDRKLFDSRTNIEKRSGESDPPRFLNNLYGGTMGGPIKKGKAFFFASFQGDNDRQTFISRSANLAILPEELSRLKATFPGNNAIAVLADFSAFALNDFGDVRPRTDIDDPFDIVALPRDPALPCNRNNPNDPNCVFFGAAFPEREFALPSEEYTLSGRADIRFSEDDNVWVRYIFQDSNFENNLGSSSGFTADVPVRVQNISGNWNRLLSSRMVNELRVSYTKSVVNFGGGCEGLKGCIPDPADLNNALSSISFFGVSGTNTFASLQTIGPATNLPQGRNDKTFQIADYLSFTRGRHQVITGVDLRVLRNQNLFASRVNGQFSINSPARLVRNSPSTVSLAVGESINNYNETDQFYFFQDDWKVRDNLTLNLGARYEYASQAINGIHDLTFERESNPSTALWKQSLPLEVRTVPKVPGDKDNIAPRLGFAYTPRFWEKLFGRDETVFRGGYAITYDLAFYNIFFNVASSSPSLFTNTTLNSLTAPVFPIPDPVPTGDKVRAFAESQGLIVRNTFDPRFFSQTTIATDFHSPYSQQWTFGFQRQINRDNIVEARYVGNHGVGLFQTVNANPRFDNLLNGFTRSVSTRNGPVVITFPGFPGLVPEGLRPQVAGQGACVDDPATTTLNEAGQCNGRVLSQGLIRLRDNSGQSTYHSLQTTYNGRIFNQLNLGATYTLSKALDNVSEVFSSNEAAVSQNPFNITGAESSYSGYDRRHVFSVNGIWDIPVFKEQRGLLGHLLGGWQVNGIYYLASGQRFTPNQFLPGFAGIGYSDSTFITSLIGREGLRPFNGNPDAPRTSVGISQIDANILFGRAITNINGFYSLNALNNGRIVEVSKNDVRYIFNGPGAARLFGSPFGDVTRNSVEGPKINQLNASFFKTTRISEQWRVQFRAQIFNLLNHPNPGYGTNSGDDTPGIFIEDAGIEGIAFNDFGDMEFNRRIIQFGLRFIF